MGGFYNGNPEDTVVGSTDATEDTINENAVTETDSTSSFYRGSPEQTTVDGYVADAAGHATAASNSASEASDSESAAASSASAAASSLAQQQNLEITSASFDTTDGTLTLTKANSGTVTTDLDGRFLTSYTEANNLSTAVTWDDVPDDYITESSVTQYQSAINAGVSITESQISNLQSYLTSETSHADVLVDGDFTSNGFMKRDGAGVYSVDSSTYATETYVDTAVSGLVDSAPSTLDTLNELASALGDDANFSTTVTTSIGTKWTEDATKIDNWDTAYSWGDHDAVGYLTAETNDLSTTVTWANVPDANITESSVTQHQAALSITESQISDLGTYLTSFDITTQTDPKYLRSDASDSSTGTISANSFSSTTGFSSQFGGLASQTGTFTTNSGNINTSLGTVSGATISGTTFTCNGNMTVNGTVDGVDIATRDGILTSTTTTANSALQNLVEDTTPQLGGNLYLNGNDITGAGNISITQSSTSTPALHIYNYDTSDVASPTIRLDRKSPTTADDDSIGKIEFYGFKDSVPSAAPTFEYANITGVLNDVSANSIDGQIDFNLSKDNLLTTVMSLNSTALELPNGTDLDVEGDITVGGIVNLNNDTTFGGNIAFTNGTHLMTVDGRDVSADGARLDTIPYHRVRDDRISSFNRSLSLTTANQNLGQYQNLYHPSTPVETMRFIDIEWSTVWSYVNSSNNDIRLSLYLTVPSTVSAVSIGTATTFSSSSYYSARNSNEQWYYVSGNHEHLFTEFGRVSQSSTGNIKQQVLAVQYQADADRTYFCATNITAPIATGDTVYFHPYAWQNANAQLLVYKDFAERYRSGTERHNVSFKLPYTDDTLIYKLNIKELSSNDSAQVKDARVRITSTGI